MVKAGKVWLSPLSEGFKDAGVLGVGSRTAIGFPASRDKLFLVTFLDSLSLEAEANVMRAMASRPASYGCFEAMNLDGGASVGLAHQGQILLPPGRNLTNVLVVYDKEYPAPAYLKQSWELFQKGSRPSPIRPFFLSEFTIDIILSKLLQAQIMTATREKIWTVEEYHRMIEAGILNEDDKIELLDGRIVEMSPQTPIHAATTQRSDRYLQHLLRDLAAIRVQLPISL
ncbi:phosphodiester glycosidase family protein [Microcoleus sp. AT8-B1]|uniref:phosphodiester glycosidase family protein n=1 Tax=unclassified Microcoleus TaxID=2642155 RepID=UPI002FD5306E